MGKTRVLRISQRGVDSSRNGTRAMKFFMNESEEGRGWYRFEAECHIVFSGIFHSVLGGFRDLACKKHFAKAAFRERSRAQKAKTSLLEYSLTVQAPGKAPNAKGGDSSQTVIWIPKDSFSCVTQNQET